MTKLSLRSCILMFLLVLPFASQARIVYAFDATCTDRYYVSMFGERTNMDCSGGIHGLLKMPDAYVPGTEYLWDSDAGINLGVAPLLSVFDDFFSVTDAFIPAGRIQLPGSSGPGSVAIAQVTSWIININRWSADQFQYVNESGDPRLAGGRFILEGRGTIFTRVSEPTSLALVLLACGGLAFSLRFRG